MPNSIDIHLSGNVNEYAATRISYFIRKFEDKPYRLTRIGFPFYRRSARLSFYPLSKNLRMVAADIARNLEFGAPTKLSNRARKGEPRFVKETLGWKSWYPWVWSRNDENKLLKNSKAWFLYFDFPNYRKIDLMKSSFLKTESIEEKTIARIGIVVSVIGRLFHLSSDIHNEINKILPENLENSNSLTVGVHIRRGENISSDGSTLRKGFIGVELDRYFEEVRKVCNDLNTKRVYLCTDSVEVRELAKKELKMFDVMTANYDSSNFFRPENSQEVSLESIWAENPKLMSFYALTAIADLYALSKCDYIIGTHSVSEFSKTAWYLAMYRKKGFVPFSSLTGSLDLSKSDSVYL